MSKLVVNAYNTGSKINRNIYGHFSEHLGRCIYEGLYVGEDSPIPNTKGMRNDVVDALRQIKIPVLRWPGGCFADEYHWKDGIGEKASRKKMINTHWGGVVEDNSFGTHEFLELCDQLGCQPYINGNVGSGEVVEMQEWIEYMTFEGTSPMSVLRERNGRKEPWPLKYFGVGNENWGCGGNMTPEYYADVYRRYQTYVRNYGSNELYKIACGPNTDDYHWTETMMRKCTSHMDALTLHYYTTPGAWESKGPALGFDAQDWYRTLRKTLYMERLLQIHGGIMQRYDPQGKVGLIVDEWGTWYDVEPGTNPGFLYQQNTMRDALVAAINLNLFNKHSHRVVMANIAQTVNVLQAVVLTEGQKMLTTPTYHVFDLYKEHQDGTLVDSYAQADCIGSGEDRVPSLHESASLDSEGRLHITLANLSADRAQRIDGVILGHDSREISATVLTGDIGDHNTFEAPDAVAPAPFSNIQRTQQGVDFELPAAAVLRITLG